MSTPKNTLRRIVPLATQLGNIVGYEISPVTMDLTESGTGVEVATTLIEALDRQENEQHEAFWALYLRIGSFENNVAFHLRDFSPDDQGYDAALAAARDILGDQFVKP